MNRMIRVHFFFVHFSKLWLNKGKTSTIDKTGDELNIYKGNKILNHGGKNIIANIKISLKNKTVT